MSERKDNGMGTVYQSKDNKWHAEIMIGTDPSTGKKKVKKFQAKTEREVKAKLKEYRKDLGKHQSEAIKKMVEKERASDHSQTLDREMLLWLRDKKQYELKQASFKRLYNTVTKQIIPRIGDLKIDFLSVKIIQRNLINAMYDDGQSQSSIKKAKSALTDYYKYYLIEEEKYSSPNIMQYLDVPAAKKFKNTKKELEYMNDEESMAFLKEALRLNANGTRHYDYGVLLALDLNTGLRIGEACALKVKDYDKKNMTLSIKRNIIDTNDIDVNTGEMSKSKLIVQDTLKTESGRRTIPLNKLVISLLDEAIKEKGKNDFIFTGRNGNLVWGTTLWRTMTKITNNAGIEKRGLHMLRHTYATALFAQGVSSKIVSELLGHANIQITLNTYVHILDELRYTKKDENKFKPYPEYLIEKQ